MPRNLKPKKIVLMVTIPLNSHKWKVRTCCHVNTTPGKLPDHHRRAVGKSGPSSTLLWSP